jgi:hypothetical protein
MKRKVRQKYYVARELRLSIVLIVLWSFLGVTFLNYVAGELSRRVDSSFYNIGYSVLAFSLILLGYAALVIFFTVYFSNRFIGPFERLKSEIHLLLSGDLRRRLTVREKDDIYIRSFLEELNKLLDDYEKMCLKRENVMKTLDAELVSQISALEREDLSKDRQRESLLLFHARLKSVLEGKTPH